MKQFIEAATIEPNFDKYPQDRDNKNKLTFNERYGDGNRQSITYQSVKPEDRDIFIFPAWIKHYVAPFYSDVTRISVSGNISNSVLLNQIKKVDKNEGK